MKRMNKRGFTLIELLAVIVILAVVLVVTIPSVISAMNNARESQFKNAADTVADWLNKQYELRKLGLETDPSFDLWYDANVFARSDRNVNTFKNYYYLKGTDVDPTCPTFTTSGQCGYTYRFASLFMYPDTNSTGYKENSNVYNPNRGYELLRAAGLSNPENDIDSSVRNYAKINGNDKFCVSLCAKENGSFYVNGSEKSYIISTGCEDYIEGIYDPDGAWGPCKISNS